LRVSSDKTKALNGKAAAFAVLLASATLFAGCRQHGERQSRDELSGMAQVRAGHAPGGCASLMACERDESMAAPQSVDAFYMDETEVTNRAYRECAASGECADNRKGACYLPDELGRPWLENAKDLPADFFAADRPAVCVSWDMARAYCASAGKRLPTEAEWMVAAGADRGFAFPHLRPPSPGDEKWEAVFEGRFTLRGAANAGAPVCCGPDAADGWAGAAPAGEFPAGGAPIKDMAGNVWEWTADCGAGNGRCAQRVIKGGSWATALNEMRIGNKAARAPHTRSADIGFRCARDAAD